MRKRITRTSQEPQSPSNPHSRLKPEEQLTAPAQPSRMGTRAIGGHFAPEVARALKILAAQHDKTVQTALAEALNDYFEKYGLERIADEKPPPRGAAAWQVKAPNSANSTDMNAAAQPNALAAAHSGKSADGPNSAKSRKSGK